MSFKSPSAIRMLEYLPEYYVNSRVMKEGVLEPEGIEIDRLYRAINDINNQLQIQTATWSLPVWEEEYGIIPPPGATDEERRSAVIAKMRSGGTANINMLESVGSSFEAGKIQIYPDHIEFIMYIEFVDVIGIPTNINTFQRAMREVIPSHYAIEYRYRFLTWNELDGKNITWDQLDAMNMTWNELEVWI